MSKEEYAKIRTKVAELQEKHKSIKFVGNECFDNDGEIEIDRCDISINENEHQINLSYHTPEDLEQIDKLLSENYKFLKILIGFQNEKEVNLILHPLSYSGIMMSESRLLKSPIELSLGYLEKILKIEIKLMDTNDYSELFYRGLQGVRSSHPYLLTISAADGNNLHLNETEVMQLSNSVLFDLEYTYGFALNTVKTENFKRDIFTESKKGKIVPEIKIELQFNKYNTDLLEYYYTAESIVYLPFRFLCYYQVMEYFLDKSAFLSAKHFISDLLKKPDYHLKKDKYVEDIVNLIKNENHRSTTDIIKIRRVLQQFIIRDELKGIIADENLLDYFNSESIFDCGEELKCPALDFENNQNFVDTLSKRIYKVRCSIVHSNPDYDKKHAIPFVSSEKNLKKLRYEVELIQIVAKLIIVKDSQ